MREVKDEPFIHYDPEQSPALYYLLERACLTAGFTPVPLCTGPEILTIANLISSGLGVTLMPNDMFTLIDSDQVVALDLENQELYSSILVIWHKANELSAITDYIIQILHKMVSTKSHIPT